MEQIEYIIYPNGRIEERVTGVAGNRCTELTRSIEQALGHAEHQELTADHYQDTTVSQPLHNITYTSPSQQEY
ncbi:MAG: DUF2997 domain-containing protein [Gemmatimonadaceae bacterium]|nr:DUF2997 domain-containing protein [Gloeobacterales cyanobacterium ES-bin-141]